MGHRNSFRLQKSGEHCIKTDKRLKEKTKNDQGWNLNSLQWKLRVLTTGPPGKSLKKRLESTLRKACRLSCLSAPRSW